MINNGIKLKAVPNTSFRCILAILVLFSVVKNTHAGAKYDYLYEIITVGMPMEDVSKKIKKLKFTRQGRNKYTASASLFRKNYTSDVMVEAGNNGQIYKINKKIYFESPKPTIKEMTDLLVSKYGIPQKTIARNMEYHLCWGGCISGNRYDLTRRDGKILMVSVLQGYMTVSSRDVGLDYQNRKN